MKTLPINCACTGHYSRARRLHCWLDRYSRLPDRALPGFYNLATLSGLFFSLLASIGGSTVLNMWWDRDIDAKMKRTQRRQPPAGDQPQETLRSAWRSLHWAWGWRLR
jgi:hypothetical protein